MPEIKELWFEYIQVSNAISESIGRTKNIVGEYAEQLIHEYYKGEILPISHPSADIKTSSGDLLQVKARKLLKTKSVQLSAIRSWKFDYLIVVFFTSNGMIEQVLKVPVKVARKHAGVKNKHQKAWIISTTKKFLDDPKIIDITKHFK